MKNISKIVGLCFILSMLLFGLAACKDEADVSGGGKPAVRDEDVIYSPYVNSTLILGEGLEESDVSTIRTAYYRNTGKECRIALPSQVQGEHEIIVGRTDRPLSERAYRYLDRFKTNDDYAGYVIYSDGRSVAIAFDEACFGVNVAFNEAVECFVSKCMQKSSLKLSSGAVFRDSFDAFEKQAERDEARINGLWSLKLSQISAKLGDEEKSAEILKDLKALRNIYNNEYSIVKWLANLYDPVTGGFYYSNSARNNEGYLPDLESTSGAIAIVESILMGYGGTLTDYFGEQIAEKFVAFTLNMQDENGYFYHPQWTRTLIDANPERRTRDMLNALNILEYFGRAPAYDTPNGVAGEGYAMPIAALTEPLTADRISAVSRLVSTGGEEIYIPAHLKTKEAFESYLKNLSIRSDPAYVCDTLASELPLYKAADELHSEQGKNFSLLKILEKYLADNQNINTGLWVSSNNITYETVAHMTNTAKLYSDIGVILPGYSIILNTLKECMKFEAEVDEMTDISSAWLALGAVVGNLVSCKNKLNEHEINSALNRLYKDLDGILSVTVEKMLLFVREDGSFSSTPEGSASDVMGMPMAIPLMDEGDMNATLIAVNSIWLSVFRVLDIGNVPIFVTSDRMMFARTLSDMGVIIKNEVKKTPPIDFENADIGTSSDVTVEAASTYGTLSEVVDGGTGHGNVLRLYSPPDRKAGTSDKFYFDIMSEVKSASCFSFELDMCVNDVSNLVSGENFAFLMIASDAYAIALNRKGDEIRFFEETSARGENSYSQDLGIRAEVGEWFNIRVEYYMGTAQTVRIKIYFNGECIAVTDNYYDYYAARLEGAGVPKSDCKKFAVYGLWGQEMDVCVDNILVEKSYMTYTAETSQSLNRNVDAPDKAVSMHDFENTLPGSVPSGFESSGKDGGISVSADSDNNRLLMIFESAGKVKLPLEQIGSDVNSALIEFDLTVSGDSKAGAVYQISFNEYLYKNRCFGALQLIVKEEGGVKYACFAEVASGKTGAVYTGVRLSLNVKYRVSIRIFFEENTMVIGLDGEIIGVSGNVLDNCRKYYMGETVFEALTPNIKSTVFVDNLVSARVRGDFEEATAPEVDRVVSGFDTSDGLYLTGVTPSGGVLSFEGPGDKEVKIAINNRVSAPTMAYTAFDVKKAGGTGELIISFTDSKSNIIAAFSLVINGSYTEIYEYTANGRYITPIHIENKSEFNLSAEYSAERESFNLLVDGEYVAASSLIYTPDSGAHKLEYLTIASSGSCDFIIDNLYAERSFGIFKEHSVSLENTDGKDGVNGYETSSFASMPECITPELGSSSSYFMVREGNIKGSVSKVLQFHTASGSSDYAFFKRTSVSEGANAAYFETDIKLELTSDNWISAELCFQSKVSGTPSQYTFNLVANKKGDALEVKGAGGKDFTKTVNVKEGEWFRLRIEYCGTSDDFDYDGYRDCIFRAYINGILVGEGRTHNYPFEVQSYDTVHQLRFAAYGSSQGNIYLDNTSLGQFVMDYERPVPADTDTLTYTPGVITNKTVFSFEKNGSSAKISEMTVRGEVSKVLDFYSAADSCDTLAVKPTLTNEEANAITFETDIMISPDAGTSTFYLEPINKKGSQAFRLTIKAAKDGNVTISSQDIPETVIGVSGEWIHLRVDYMNPRVDYNGDRRLDILYKIYTDNSSEALATGYKPYNSGAYYEPAELTEYLFTVTKESRAGVCLDNTRFWQTELTADKAPEFDYSDEDFYGNSDEDEDAWTR